LSGDRKSQRQRILDLLRAACGQEVPSVALSRISLQYGARVKELRELGFKIVNRTERQFDQVHGYFRLEIASPTARETERDSVRVVPAPEVTGSLFDNLEPDRSYRE
jgi:hypothetical protein